jgi:hypothetical protein
MYDHIVSAHPNLFKYADSKLDGMVLCKEGICTVTAAGQTSTTMSVCKECWSVLQTQSRRSKQSLSNNLFRDPTPPALSGLTLAEEMLISRYRTRVFLVKLVGDSGRGEPGTQQTGYKGSVVSFEQENLQAVDLLPSLPDTLLDQFAVFFVGTKKPKPEAFK